MNTREEFEHEKNLAEEKAQAALPEGWKAQTLSFAPDLVIGRCPCGCGGFLIVHNGREFSVRTALELLDGIFENYLTEEERRSITMAALDDVISDTLKAQASKN